MSDWLIILIFIWFIFVQIRPLIHKQARQRLIRRIETQRKSKLITLVHRQHGLQIFGLLFGRYIDIEDAQTITRIIRTTPKNTPIDLLIHTPGGLVLASKQIAQALANHPAKVRAFVPYHALSGGTLIALAADTIYFGHNAILGRVDPQIQGVPAISIHKVLTQKPIAEIDDKTIILADISQKSLASMKVFVKKILAAKGYQAKAITSIQNQLLSDRFTHDEPVDFKAALAMGLWVSDQLPATIYDLIKLYPQERRKLDGVETSFQSPLS
jgi:ClpP class serine protease